MLSNILFGFIFLLFNIISSNAKESCNINLKSIAFRPFVLNYNGNLWNMEDDSISMKHSENATLTCQIYNFEKYPKLSSIRVLCDDGKLKSDDGKAVSINDFKCDLKIIDIFKCDVKGCPENHIGSCFAYFDKTLNSNVKIAEVCYESKIGRTRFVRMQISKKLQQIGSSISDGKLSDFFEKIDIISNMIRMDNEDKLSALLEEDGFSGDDVLVQKLIPENLINEQYRDAQRYPINNIGVWRSVFNGNWKKIVQDVKSYLSSKEDSVELMFGTKDTLKSHSGKAIYSKGKKEMIPQFVWVSLRDLNAENGEVVVVINDPYISVGELKNKMFCKNMCDKISWLKNVMKKNDGDRPAMGYTFCCSIDDFEKHF